MEGFQREGWTDAGLGAAVSLDSVARWGPWASGRGEGCSGQEHSADMHREVAGGLVKRWPGTGGVGGEARGA